jgi:hypothetical protein
VGGELNIDAGESVDVLAGSGGGGVAVSSIVAGSSGGGVVAVAEGVEGKLGLEKYGREGDGRNERDGSMLACDGR